MEKQSVEDSLKHAFQDAEMRPSSEVWTHIELGIEKEEGNELKKSVVFYRWMAAASVLIAVSLLGVGYVTMYKDWNNHTPLAINTETTSPLKSGTIDTKKNNESLSTTTTTSPALNHDSEQFDKGANNPKGSVSNNSFNGFDNARSDITSPGKSNTNALTGNTLIEESNSNEFLAVEQEKKSPKYKNRARSPLPPLVVQRPYKIHFPKTEPDQIDLLLAAIEMEEKESKKKKGNRETLWTSVGMAAGTYNPVIASASGARAAFAMDGSGSLTNAQVVNLSNQVEASGYSFSSGVSVGGKVADRWIVQGGVNYLTQNSTYNSNAVLVDGANNFKLASLNTFSRESYGAAFYQASSPYTVSSSLQYFNIPLQAGYLIINKDFGWQLQGGISTDFFLQNTLSAEDAGFDKVSQGGGDASPYRTVNFSGLIGTEVSYRFGEHYRVAINPGFRYPLQSVYKSDTGVSAAPIMFDVGLKFHYIFR